MEYVSYHRHEHHWFTKTKMNALSNGAEGRSAISAFVTVIAVLAITVRAKSEIALPSVHAFR